MTDYAPPIQLDSVKPRDLNDIRPGGLGIHFIRKIMDVFKISHLQGNKGNYMELLINLD